MRTAHRLASLAKRATLAQPKAIPKFWRTSTSPQQRLDAQLLLWDLINRFTSGTADRADLWDWMETGFTYSQLMRLLAEDGTELLTARARQCAELLHTHLPEHFPTPADMVLVWHAGAWWALVDITLRMLKPRELFNAQGFPADYIISHGADGKPFTKTQQVHMCGNSVSPPPMAALARANDPWRAIERQAVAA